MSAAWDLARLFDDERPDLAALARSAGTPSAQDFTDMRELLYARGHGLHEADTMLRLVFFPVPSPGPLVTPAVAFVGGYRDGAAR